MRNLILGTLALLGLFLMAAGPIRGTEGAATRHETNAAVARRLQEQAWKVRPDAPSTEMAQGTEAPSTPKTQTELCLDACVQQLNVPVR